MKKEITRRLASVGLALVVAAAGANFNVISASVGSVGKISATKIKGNSWGMSFTSGYKLSWKKLSDVTGYKVYAYGVASKKWRCIKTTKNNSYILTNLLSRDKAKIKVRAYKVGSNKKTVYGKFSKSVTKKAKGDMYQVDSSGYCKKSFKDDYAAQMAFDYQNKMRKKAKAKKLKWSNVLQKIADKRVKQIVKKFSHAKFESTAKSYLKKTYKIKSKYAKIKKGNITYSYPYAGGENIAYGYGDYKSVMKEWKKSKGHYANIKKKSFKSGAIACYMSKTKGVYWVAIFSELDVDKYIKENFKAIKDKSDKNEIETVQETEQQATTAIPETSAKPE